MMKLLTKILITLSFTLSIVACEKPEPFASTDVTGANFAQTFSFRDTQEQTITNQTFAQAGQLTVVYFGFTRCPDVCPTTLLQVKAVKQGLEKAGLKDKLRLIFISVDPERDSAQYLNRYVTQFDPSFIAVRPETPQALQAIAKQFNVFYQKADIKDKDHYNVDHTSALYVYDTKGQFRLYVPHNIKTEDIINDFKQLLK